MEVHHHPHVEKKGFKEYFLEFIMIFLAVTLGFFAEGLREHIADGNKEKRNIENVIKSVSIDTAHLNKIIELNEQQVKGIDSFILIKNEDVRDNAVKWKYYYYTFNYLVQDYYFLPTNAGIEQLKSSGGFSLIKSQSVADSIQGYDIFNNYINQQAADGHYSLMQLLDLELKVVDISVLKDASIGWTNSNYNNDSLVKKLPAISNDPVVLKQFFGYTTVLSLSNGVYIYDLKNQLQRGRNLIAFLQKEYHL